MCCSNPTVVPSCWTEGKHFCSLRDGAWGAASFRKLQEARTDAAGKTWMGELEAQLWDRVLAGIWQRLLVVPMP